MQRSFFVMKTLLMSSALLGTVTAQQAPATNPPPPSTTHPRPTTTTKPHTATVAKRPKVLTLDTQKDKASYAIGLNIGKNMKRDSVDIDPKIMLQGVQDALTGGKPLLTDDQVKAAMMTLQEDMRKKQEDKQNALLAANKKEGEAFLAANSTKEGVVTLPSGLQYKVLKEGTGPKPSADDSVVCNYRGTLLDSTEFDSSYKRGQPATFAVNRVIKGWTEALQLMPTGSKWQLFIPSALAYGERGQGATIAPDATLVFEVELISIQPKAETTK